MVNAKQSGLSESARNRTESWQIPAILGRMNDQRKTEKQMLGDLEQKRKLVSREQGISTVLQNVSNKVAEAKRQTESRPGTIRPRNNRYNT